MQFIVVLVVAAVVVVVLLVAGPAVVVVASVVVVVVLLVAGPTVVVVASVVVVVSVAFVLASAVKEVIAAVASTATSNFIIIFEDKIELGLMLDVCDFLLPMII